MKTDSGPTRKKKCKKTRRNGGQDREHSKGKPQCFGTNRADIDADFNINLFSSLIFH